MIVPCYVKPKCVKLCDVFLQNYFCLDQKFHTSYINFMHFHLIWGIQPYTIDSFLLYILFCSLSPDKVLEMFFHRVQWHCEITKLFYSHSPLALFCVESISNEACSDNVYSRRWHQPWRKGETREEQHDERRGGQWATSHIAYPWLGRSSKYHFIRSS